MPPVAASLLAHTQSALAQIDQAGDHHDRWFEGVLRCVACRLPADPRDLAHDAHKRCAFGFRYDELAPPAVRNNTGFAALGEAHEMLHNAAAGVLKAASAGDPIPAERFDDFIAALKRFRLHLATLRREFEEAVSGLDPLTGAGNRAAMLPYLRQQHAMVQRGVARCVVAMLDLDRFKAVNDTYGHAAGDRVLAAAAGHILRNLRPYDRLFRYGGEEFLLCVPDADPKLGLALVERLREGVAALAIDAGADAPLRITLSAGIAALDPASSVERAIESADRAMYAAKAAGRNRTSVSAAAT